MRLVYDGGGLMLVVVGQEAGGVSEAAASCRGAAAAATHVPPTQLLPLFAKPRGPRLGQEPRNNAWHNAKILNLETGQLPSLEVRLAGNANW